MKFFDFFMMGVGSSVIPFRHLVTGLQLEKAPWTRFLERAPKTEVRKRRLVCLFL